MDLKNISKKLVGSDEERAVSPVIGVILMVAITVILAAVIAAFVLDLGDTSEPAQATLDISEDAENNTDITVQNADRVDDIVIRADCFDEDVSVSHDDIDLELEVGDAATIDATGDLSDETDGGDDLEVECAGEGLTFVAQYDGNEEIIHQFDYEGDESEQ